MAAYEKLTAMDRVFLDIENDESHMHVAGTLIFDAGPLRTPEGGIDVDRVRDYMHSRLHQMPRYRQKLAFAPITGEPVWIDDRNFNINYHVRHTSLPKPGDERLLKRLSGRIMSQKLDRGKPLWECWIVEGLTGDRFAMISKTHHCMIDGISGVDLMGVLLSPYPDDEVPEPPHWKPEPEPSPYRVLFDEALSAMTLPFTASRAVCAAARDPLGTARRIGDGLSALSETLSATTQRASDTPLNRDISPHRRFDWVSFDLAEVKAVKNALGGTVNDVVLATVAGAVGRFLAQRGTPRARQGEVDFRVYCPVSVRSDAERGTLGNRISGMVVQLPIAEESGRRRMAAVTEATRDVKDSKQALGAEVLAAVSEWTTHTLLSLGARLATSNRTYNMVVTNVPGPQIPLYMVGAKMLETYPMVPLFNNQSLGIALFSYAGKLHWGFNADYDAMPDLHDFVEAMKVSFAELCQSARVHSKVSAARADPATDEGAAGGLESSHAGNGSTSATAKIDPH